MTILGAQLYSEHGRPMLPAYAAGTKKITIASAQASLPALREALRHGRRRLIQ